MTTPEARDRSTSVTLQQLAAQLSEGLNLCVRARKLDDASEAGAVGHAGRPNGGGGTRCGTPALWAVEQYERDLAAWEASTRAMLCNLPECE